MEKVVLGIVDTPQQAEITARRLEVMGFPPVDISMLFPDRRGSHDFGFEHHTKAPEGALAGAIIGAVAGAALGMMMGLGLFAIPGLGALVAAGPVIAALTVAAVLATICALVGAIVGLTVPEIQAKHYVGKVRTGSILVGVHVNDREEVSRAREVMRSVAAVDITAAGEAAIPPGERT